MTREENTREVERIGLANGIDAIGIADLKSLGGLRTYPKQLLKGYRYGVSLVVGMDKFDAYDMEVEGEISFPILRAASELIAHHIRKKGYKAKVIDPDDPVEQRGPLYYKGPLSLKAVANAAGLGWIGKSALFVSHEFGPRVNLGAVITDMPMIAGKPCRNRCGRCVSCAKACPLGLLTATDFDVHPKDLDDILRKEQCNEWLERPEVKGKGICWECVLECPKGKRPKRSARHMDIS